MENLTLSISRRADPTVIYPVIQENPPELSLSNKNFDDLEKLGKIKLSAQLRVQLGDLAHFWAGSLSTFASPRPKQFRERLRLIAKTLSAAQATLDLNRAGTSAWEYHLYNWARNSGVDGSETYFEDTAELLARMKAMIELMQRLEAELPNDRGQRRAFGDEQLLLRLASIFECAGGTTAFYWTEHPDSGMADTAFRKFAQAFYQMLPVQQKRTPAGLDGALRAALRSRRSSPAKGKLARQK